MTNAAVRSVWLAAVTITCGVWLVGGVARAGSYEQAFGPFAVNATAFGDGSELRSNQLGTTAKLVDAVQKELQLTADGTTGTYSAFVLPDLDPGSAVNAFTIKWNAQLYASTTHRADGFALTFGQIPAGNGSGETGFGLGLCVAAKTYRGAGDQGFRLYVNGLQVAYTAYSAWPNLDGTRHCFEVELKSDGKVNFWMDGTQYLTEVASGYTPQVGDRFAFTARTGGEDEEYRIDNIMAYTGARLEEGYWLDHAASGTSLASESPDKAFDRLSTTKWLAQNLQTPYLQARTVDGKPRRVVGYTITSANDAATRDPKTWRVQGSADAATWYTVDTESYGEWGAGRYIRRAFLVNSPGDYKWYRLQVDSNHGDVSMQLADFRPLMLPTSASVAASVIRSTIRDFDRIGLVQTPCTITRDSGSHTPGIVAGGVMSNVLQLTDGGVGQAARAAFDRTCRITDPIYGSTPTIVIDFDFRAQPVTGQADGFSLVLLRTADYGSSGAGVSVAPAEEPNLTSASGANLGIGFDTYLSAGDPDNNHVSLHYGSTLTQNSAPFDFSTTRFHHAQIVIVFRENRTGADVTVKLQENSLGMNSVNSGTPATVVNSYGVTGILPYDFRVLLAARTGGETMLTQFDNLQVLCGSAAWGYAADFRGGEANFGLVGDGKFRTDNGGAVYQQWLNVTDNGGSKWGAGWLSAKQLVEHGFTCDFQWRISHMNAGGADGLCFSLQNNDLLQSGGETGCATKALNLSFRTYGSTPSDTFMELRDGSTVLKTANLKAVGFDFGYNPAAAGQYAGRYTMHVDYVPRDLDVYINDTLVFDSVNVDLETLANGSAVDADGKAYIGFSARTGGATENHDILNLRLASYVRATLGSLFICK